MEKIRRSTLKRLEKSEVPLKEVFTDGIYTSFHRKYKLDNIFNFFKRIRFRKEPKLSIKPVVSQYSDTMDVEKAKSLFPEEGTKSDAGNYVTHGYTCYLITGMGSNVPS